MDKEMKQTTVDVVMFLIMTLLIIVIALMAKSGKAFEVDTTKAVIHHTASHDVSVKTIDRWHKERGWDGIGYNYVIRKSGAVEKGRELYKRGAHAKGRNGRVGIVLTGYDTFTPLQSEALERLLRNLGVQEIEAHHERCPGKGLDLSKIKGVKYVKHY